MDMKFQDRIDNYLLNRMNDADKEAFLWEVEQDEKKKEQLEFTKHVKDSICSREEKLQTLAQLQQRYEDEREATASRHTGTECAARYQTVPDARNKMSAQSKNRTWLWVSGIAAVLVVGLFAIRPIFIEETSPSYDGIPLERIRGGDEIFNDLAPADTIGNDTIKHDLGKKLDE